MLIIHLIGLSLGLGSSFIFIFLGSASAKLEKEEASKFMVRTFSLSTMAHIGLTLSLISGFYLMTPYWKVLSTLPLLISKLVFVGLFILTISLIGVAQNKAKKGGSESQLRKIRTLSAITLFSGLTIVVLAVLVFG